MKSAGIDHIALYTAEPRDMIRYFRDRMGFTAHPAASRTGEHDSVLLHQNDIRLLVNSPRGPDTSGGRYLARHGDGVADIAIRVDDVRAAFDGAVARGARPIAEPAVVSRPGIQPVLAASVQGPGDLVHTLVEAPEPVPATPPIGPLLTVDHVAMCVPAGELTSTTQFYCDVFGFHTIFSEKIVLGDQGMDSKVVRNDSGQITFTLIEPDATRSPGQIDMFLDRHGGAGVQHLAFATADIARTVREMRDRSLEFLVAPPRYYAMLAERLPELAEQIAALRELNVLVDRDHWGHLLQIFTKSVHPAGTLFFELIERRNARTFGSGNIRALYAAVEQDMLSGVSPDRP